MLRTAARFLAVAGLLSIGILRAAGSTTDLFALFAALAALGFLAASLRHYGVFSVGGITWAMVSILFVGRWFFPPVSPDLLTARALTNYDRSRALVASAVMIMCFTVSYLVVSRQPAVATLTPPRRRASLITSSVTDLAIVCLILVIARGLSGYYLHIGVPGQPAEAVPLVGIIYFATSYGPLAGAALILWLGRASRTARLAAGAVLVSLVLVESSLGSHGTAFHAIIVYGAALTAVRAPRQLTLRRAISLAAMVAGVITVALLIAFIARTELNGGARRSLSEVPAFVVNRLGGIEFLAPTVGAVDLSGSDVRHLRPASWSNYVLTGIYGLPADAHTGFATTAVGWWYGIGGLTAVGIGGALSGLFASLLDRWAYRRGSETAGKSDVVVLGVWLGWATFLLGGTIRSLVDITVGFSFMALALARVHHLVSGSISVRLAPETSSLASDLTPAGQRSGGRHGPRIKLDVGEDR